MSFAESIKARIKEADVEKQLTELVDEGEKLVREAVTRAGEVAHDRRTDVEGWLDKATGTLNAKTDGKYADQVTKVRTTLLAGLDKLAAHRRPDAPETSDETPSERSGELPDPGEGPDPAAPQA